MVSKKLVANAKLAADFLAAFANPWRLLIMSHLASTDEMSVGAIGEKVMLSQSALSQHLSKLRALSLVETRRESQTIYYSCKSSEARELLSMVEDMYGEATPEMKPRHRSIGR